MDFKKFIVASSLVFLSFFSIPAGAEETFANQEEKDQFLLLAISTENLEKVISRLKAGANPNTKDKLGQTALFMAVQLDDPGIAKTLLENGANPNLTAIGGATPLQMAAYEKSQTMVDLLLKKGAKWDLLSASMLGNEKQIGALLKAKANPNLKGALGATPLTVAKNGKVIQLLVNGGAKPDLKGVLGKFPLHHAAELGEELGVKALLGAGADKKVTTEGGKTAAQIAREKGHSDLAKLLE